MRINVIAFSSNGCLTAIRVRDALAGDDVRLYCKTTHENHGVERVEGPLSKWTETSFSECDGIVFVGALGIAVRHIAPFIRSKDVDPAVVGIDELGRWTIALLSGHIGGCNRLTERIAEGIGSEPIVTTATDINGKFSVDTFATLNHMRIMGLKTAKDVSARVLDGRFVGFCSDFPVEGELPAGLTEADSGEFGVCVSSDPGKRPFGTTMRLIPMDISLGVGCKRDTDPAKLHEFIHRILEQDGIAPERVASVASIDLKKDEAAILELAESLGVPARFYTPDELNSLEGSFSESSFVASVTSVDCVCERSAAMAGGEPVRRKTAENGMTVAIYKMKINPRFV